MWAQSEDDPVHGQQELALFNAHNEAVRNDIKATRTDIKPKRIDSAPVRAGSEPKRQSDEPRDHAVELLDWLHGPNGKCGWFTVEEPRTIHAELLIELHWTPIPWAGIGRELHAILRQPKHYRWQNGRHVRVYWIGPVKPEVIVTAPNLPKPKG